MNQPLPKDDLTKSALQVAPPQMPPQYYYPPEDDTIDLVDLVKTLWRYRLWMVALTAAAVIGAAVYVQIAPKTYTASVIYELKNQPEAEARLKGLYQTRAFLGYFLEESGYLPQVLNDLYDPSTKTYQITDDRLSAVELGAARLQGGNPPFFEFVAKDGVNQLVVNYKNPPDPALTAQIANDSLRWAESYFEQQALEDLEENLPKRQIQLERLAEQLEETQNQLDQAYAEYSVELAESPAQTLLTEVQLTALAESWGRLQDVIGERQAALVAAQSAPSDPAEVTSLEAQLGTLINRANAVQQILLDQEVAREIERKFQARTQTIQSQLENDQKAVSTLQQAIRSDERQAEELKLAMQRAEDFVEIVDAAIAPTAPSKPNAKLIIALAFVVGLFASIFIVFLVDFIKNLKSNPSGE